LTLTDSREEDRFFDGELFQGTLACACGNTFEIVQGVPILLPTASGETEATRENELDPDTRGNKEIWDYIWDQTARMGDSYFLSEEFFQQEILLPRAAFDGRRILEVGIASGKNVPFYLERRPSAVFGVDVTDQLFDAYRQYADRQIVCFVMADIKHMPFRPRAFDIVVASRVLHHVPDMPRRYAELVDLLAPGGVFSSVLYGSSPFARIVRLGGKAASRVLSLDQLLSMTELPSRVLYLAIQHLYVPLADSTAVRRLLPLREGMVYWSRFDPEWLWKAVVFDILASAPVTTYTTEKELRRILEGLDAERYEYCAQFGAMWNILVHR